jgi:hypothetical protein
MPPVGKNVESSRRLQSIVPQEWCKGGAGFAFSGGIGRGCQAVAAGSLTLGSSRNRAMVSRVMQRAR